MRAGQRAAIGGTDGRTAVGLPRRGAAAAVVAAMLWLLLGLGSAPASAASRSILTAGPLTRVEISDVLNCAVSHVEDAQPEFYGDTACATLLAVDGHLYSPAVIPLGAAAQGTPYTPLSQSEVLGSGTSADPYRIVTVVAVGSTGLRITQTDSYIVGQESYRTDVRIDNLGSADQAVILWRAGDCYLQDSDGGYGRADTASGTVACVAPDPDDVTVPGHRIVQWLPLSGDSHYYEASYDAVWAHIGDQQPFTNTCACDEYLDNGAGLSWQATVPAEGVVTRSHLTTFSPVGQVPLPVGMTADAAQSAPGAGNGYTVTVSNPNVTQVTVTSIHATLPADFAYVAGSTSGVSSADPAIAGERLTWSGSFAIPASGLISLHFAVVVSPTVGTYYSQAGGEAEMFTVTSTGDTAPVEVTSDSEPVPNPTPSPDPDPTPDPDPDPTPAPTPGDPQVLRLSGPSRITTAVALSQHSRPDGADAVLLARADAYPDALAGAPLAAQLDAPVLLTGGAGLDPAVAAEIDRLGATAAYLLGGTNALSPQVESDLRAQGVADITRVAGSDRFQTAARIGERVVGARVGQVPVYVVEGANADPGRGWPDAVSVSGLAALQERPILLVTRDQLPEQTRAALDGLGVPSVTIVGGTAAVSEPVAAAIADRDVDGQPETTVSRLAGVTRYETSRAVADRSVADGADPAVTWFATGRNYPDALAAGPAVGDSGGVLLLLDGQSLDGSPPARAWLTDHRSSFLWLRLVGGLAAISQAVEDEIRAAAAG